MEIDLSDPAVPDAPDAAFLAALKDRPFLILNYFDHNIDIPDVCLKRLQFLFTLKKTYPDKQLILISNRNHINIKGILETEVIDSDGQPVSQKGWQYEENKVHQLLIGFRKIFYPPDRWKRIITKNELIQTTEKRPVYFQIAPERFHLLAQAKESRKVLEHLSFEESGNQHAPQKWFLKTETGTCPLGTVLLVSHEDTLEGLKDKLDMVEDHLAGKTQAEQEGYIHILVNGNPIDLLRKYDEAMKDGPVKKATGLLVQKERWQHLFFLLGKALILLDLTPVTDLIKNQNRILKECNNGGHLQGIQQKLLEQSQKTILSDEELIRKIEVQVQLYYQALWSSLSSEEQFLTQELAYDGIVNARNGEVFKDLIRKGIIITAGDSPVIMNKSFRNFVLNAEPEQVRMKIREMAREKDDEVTWRSIQWPIAIILLAFLTFLFATQKEFIDNTLALFTGVAAAIPVINRILSSLSSMGSGLPKFPFGFGNKS